jgi:hypothetical protein
MGAMRRWAVGFFSFLALPGAQPAHHIEIKLPPGVASESFFVRYKLAGEDFGGWVQPLSGVSSYVIETTVRGRLATGIRAILYAPGCSIQTLDLALPASNNPTYWFVCQPVRTISITGALSRTDRLYASGVEFHARYVARWAQAFLGTGDGIVTSIPVGDAAYLWADGRFRLEIPDLSKEPNHPGDLQILARDRTTGAVVAQLIPIAPQFMRTRMGGLKVQNAYPPEIVFTPCASDAHAHDLLGFASRSDAGDGCGR